MPWRISFEIQGETFCPSQVRFPFTQQHDPGAIGNIGRYLGTPISYGSASYVAPRSIPIRDRIKHLVEAIEPLLPSLSKAGATDWDISIGRYYHAQCNEEYSFEELQLIVRLKCGVTYSAYQVSEEEENELNDRY